MSFRRRCPHGGQSLVEFALIAPLLFALMFILVELGIVFSIYVGLTNSAREAARVGVSFQYEAPSGATTTPAYTDIDTQREAQMDGALRATLNPIIVYSDLNQLNPASGTRYSYSPNPPQPGNVYRYGDLVVVTLRYNHGLFFNLLGPRSINIQSSSTMRLEPGGL